MFLGAFSILVTTLPIRNVVPALAAGYSSTILADSATAYWRLGELTGTSAADATGHGNTGTYSGGFTLAQPGALFGDTDTAVKLDGVSGYVTAPNSVGLQSNIGWSGKKGVGDTFRIAIGEKPGPVIHFDLWPFNT